MNTCEFFIGGFRVFYKIHSYSVDNFVDIVCILVDKIPYEAILDRHPPKFYRKLGGGENFLCKTRRPHFCFYEKLAG